MTRPFYRVYFFFVLNPLEVVLRYATSGAIMCTTGCNLSLTARSGKVVVPSAAKSGIMLRLFFLLLIFSFSLEVTRLLRPPLVLLLLFHIFPRRHQPLKSRQNHMRHLSEPFF